MGKHSHEQACENRDVDVVLEDAVDQPAEAEALAPLFLLGGHMRWIAFASFLQICM